MSVSRGSSGLGRHVFGLAAVACGITWLVWHDYRSYDQLHSIVNATDGPLFVYAAAAAQIFGGLAIQFRGAAKTGAIVLGVVYLVFALLLVPPIAATPLVFDPWGDFFEQFSVLFGAAIVFARLSSAWTPQTLNRFGRIVFGVCTLTFAAYQAVHLAYTASLVPKWIPPSQMFWSIATTVAFALAAVALFVNRMALLATGLMTAMLVLFGLLVWVPAILAAPRTQSNWTEITLNFAIAGAAWIFADLLAETGPGSRRSGRARP